MQNGNRGRRRGAAVLSIQGHDGRTHVIGLMAAIIPAAAILVACAGMLAAFS